MSEGNIGGLNLNVEEESKGAGFAPLPPGEYTAMITKSEAKENKSGAGMHISATFQIVEGDYEGRLLFANWNVQNSNPTAEKIGRAELAACCRAVGVMNPQDSTELHDKPILITVGLDKKDPTRNVIKGYDSLNSQPPGTEAAPAAKAAAPVAAAAPAATGKKPWQKK